MIKVQPIVRDIVMSDFEAYSALVNGYMNMSGYAYKIKSKVEALSKKKVTINSLVVSLSRLRQDFKKAKPLIREVPITNVTTKLPLTEIIYENSDESILKLESLHKKLAISRKDFFTSTVSTTELNIVCSSSMAGTIMKHFGIKPKFITHDLTAVGISFGKENFEIPNTLFSLISVVARARINIAEIISTYTELIFIVAEKDFSRTVSLFSDMYKSTQPEI